MQFFDLDGKVAVVTGATSGIGKAIACGLAHAGADVALIARTTADDTEATIRSYGRKVQTFRFDIAESESSTAIVESVLSVFGTIDILVNAAGITVRTPAIDFRESDWDSVLAVNAKAVFLLSQAVARTMMRRRQGKIINIASLMSFQGGITIPAYTASKGAVAQLTKALANEWAPFGINVNAIAPGYIATKLTAALQNDPKRNNEILARIPAGRWGTPADLQGAAIFLSSPASDYIHGHVLLVDGGWMGR